MSTGLIFIIIGIILVFILEYNQHFSSRKFINDNSVYFKGLMEDDYKFLLEVKYGKGDLDVDKLFNQRVRNGLVIIVVMFFIFLQDLSFAYVILSILAGCGVVKLQ